MRCESEGTTFLAEGDPTVKLRRFPNTATFQSYGSPPVTYSEKGACPKIKACPVGKDMPMKGEFATISLMGAKFRHPC